MTIAQLPIHIMLITPIAVALFVLGILVAAGKADRWIAGYNTASEEERAKVNINHLTRTRSIASLPCKIVLRNLMRLFTKKSFCHQGFFAVKRRAVFILGAKWIALVRGWRRDCVVGGMETRFQ